MSFEIINVSYTYNVDTSFQKAALKDISFSIPDGAFVGIAGASGSGKTTLVRLLKGLIMPSSGIIKSSCKSCEIGLVFQYPELQLFESTVLKDVMFGPLNIGMEEGEAKRLRRRLFLRCILMNPSLSETRCVCLEVKSVGLQLLEFLQWIQTF